ncbi:ribosome biogenesis GTPase [Filimonas zeae]|uniref:Small ribosomal subunit biogenesis GTPase RsgA n=1 Tax=Filimonas zeae TaxID=1737353 RepID=A0A917N0B7_9BACT|nr:ribosome small subunit-dependent GTPase A [Filimonas zeae]MDR6341938.1 ribosome biogenesis GTPase [Filimonas zeae]GGH79748.1 putative ribosome biogenesis GTPase RsgA [Filimonas zeae]
MRALIYKSTGSWYTAKGEDGQVYNARVRGAFKVEGLTSTNPIAVGDEVELTPEDEADHVATITEIHDRRNYIARTSPHNKNKHHIVASNVDQTLLFATLKEPRTSQGFLDRFLVSAEAYHVPAVVIFNKCDLFKKKEEELYAELEAMYKAIGYGVLRISLKTGEGVEKLRTQLSNKTSLVSGHSGVGKSTFINTLFPDMELRTQEVSGWSGKGLHTTTFAEMFDLPFNGKIIDTPGIREFGLVDISRQELSHYFPEMRALLNNCQFNNCLHINEPGCAVKTAVESGEIAESRFLSYYSILESIDDKNY